MGKLWVGIDAGKDFHWAAAINEAGDVVLSRRVENDEGHVTGLVAEVRRGGTDVSWAVDIPGGVAALTLAVLWARGERVMYVPGIAVDRSRDAYPGEAKTDVRDARIIAEQARTRRDLPELRRSGEILAELAVLTHERRSSSHPPAEILVSLPGMGPRLGADFWDAVGDLRSFDSADHLAAYAGLVPVARNSGKRSGNLRRMHGSNKALKRVFYQSAFASLRTPESRAFYDRKRAQGERHHQAVIALARRRVNVVWAMLRGGETMFKPLAA